MAYRIAMITMSATALLTMWELVRKLAGSRAARLSLVLGIITPFIYYNRRRPHSSLGDQPPISRFSASSFPGAWGPPGSSSATAPATS